MSYRAPIMRRKKRDFAIVADDGGGILTETEIEEMKAIELPPPESPDSQSVLGEILEAFGEIAFAFNGMGKAFTNFGNVIETEAGNLGTQMKNSANNIKEDIGNVVSEFSDMGKNLANTFETK